MWPTLVKIGNFEITTFGLMMFLAFIIGGWVLAKQFRRYGLDEEIASSMVVAGALGGIIGAKVYYAILFRDWHLLFDRAGLVWYGGMIGGFLACVLLLRSRRVDFLTVADATAPAISIGYALGRIGCFLVGDDYGRSTNAWFGVAFPKGAPPTTAQELRDFGVAVDPSIPSYQVLRVHPTQLYETAAALLMFGILLWMNKRPHPKGRTWGVFLILLGIERFLVEIVRAKDDRFLGPFTIAQLISVLLVIAGAFWAFRRERELAVA
ncbi:MAG TPA: prolipoprotein diacylglyceryl transferase [Thermoanaerobaculia bacterium]|nr:prolipoprotein diacylglyceryl transferase [Thermoanaerobaculia bacterium]